MKFFIVFAVFVASAFGDDVVPEYIQQCHEEDPKLIQCLTGAIHHLRPYLARGIPDIELPAVEPFIIDELSLSLTSGPNGYKITLKDLEVYGASNYSLDRLKLSDGDKPFEARVKIPQLKLSAQYTSSGVLIILPASGGGTLTGAFEGVTALVRGRVSSKIAGDGKKYLHVDDLVMDLKIKDVRLQVQKIFNNNRILIEATNLFLRENGHEVIKAMGPQLTKKLSVIFKNIANKLVTHVSVDKFLIPAKKS